MWYWRRLLRVPWTAWRSNQSILKEISPGYSLEWLMLRLKLQILATWCEELTHCIRPWFWERLKMGGKWDDRGWDVWIASPVGWAWVWVSSWRWWWTAKPGILQSMGALSQSWLSNSTELITSNISWGFIIYFVMYHLPHNVHYMKAELFVIFVHCGIHSTYHSMWYMDDIHYEWMNEC